MNPLPYAQPRNHLATAAQRLICFLVIHASYQIPSYQALCCEGTNMHPFLMHDICTFFRTHVHKKHSEEQKKNAIHILIRIKVAVLYTVEYCKFKEQAYFPKCDIR